MRHASTRRTGQALLKAGLAACVLSALVGPRAVTAATLHFDSFTGVNFLDTSIVPEAARLSDDFLATDGVVFRTVGGADFVAVSELEVNAPTDSAPSPPNGIGGVKADGTLTFTLPLEIRFFDPLSPTTRAVTDFVSITGDLRAVDGNIVLQAFDAAGILVDSDTQPDSPGGRIVSVSAAGIHFVTVHSESGTVAFDDLIFNPVTAVPLPGAAWLLLSGIVVVARFAKGRSR